MTCWSCQSENDLSERQTCARCGAPLVRSSGVFQKSVLVGIVVALLLLQLVCVFGGILRRAGDVVSRKGWILSEESKPAVGTISWVDLTVADAPAVRDFYAAVAGWTPAEVPMGGYSDYGMNAPGGKTVAGVCHARGANESLPAQWLVYIIVADLDASLAECRARGGAVIAGPKAVGGEARYAVIRDPAGAVAALYQHLA